MKVTLTLEEARKIFGEQLIEVKKGFLLKDFGRYAPNINFAIDTTFDLGKNGKILNPMRFMKDDMFVRGMGLTFDGDARFLLGDFWRTPKGFACFRPQDPLEAKYILLCIDWGGAFTGTLGIPAENADIYQPLHFRKVSSESGRTGIDYIVLPLDYKHSLSNVGMAAERSDDAWDAANAARVRAFRQKHKTRQAKEVKEADAFLTRQMSLEAASREAKQEFSERLEEIERRLALVNEMLNRLCNSGKTMTKLVLFAKQFSMGETYFEVDGESYLYNEENVALAEVWIAEQEQEAAEIEANILAEEEARAEFEPKFTNLAPRMRQLGWTVKVEFGGVKLELPRRKWGVRIPDNDDYIIRREYGYNIDDYTECLLMTKSAEDRVSYLISRRKSMRTEVIGLSDETGAEATLDAAEVEEAAPDVVKVDEVAAVAVDG